MWCITYQILRHLQTFKRFFWKLVNKRVSKCTSSFRLVKVTLNCNKSFHFIYDSNLNLQICNCLHFANPFIHSSCSLNEIKIFLSNNRSQCCDDKAPVVEFKLKSSLIWTWWCWNQSCKEIAFHLEHLHIVLLEMLIWFALWLRWWLDGSWIYICAE